MGNDRFAKETTQKIIEKTALAASTVTGIMGAITAIPAVQVVAYFPAVMEKVILEQCGKKGTFERKLQEDLKAVISDTCREVQSKIDSISAELARFFHTTSMKIVNDTRFLFSAEAIEGWIRDAMKEEKKWECPKITEKDMEMIMELFLSEFVVQLVNYPQLADFLNVTAVFDLERRVGDLEKEVEKQRNVKNVNPPGLPESICGDVVEYKDKYEEALFLHRNLPKEKQISLKHTFVMPSVTFCGRWADIVGDSETEEVISAIREFICYRPSEEENSVDFLFIEGQAAMGKSSLVSRMAWQYCCEPEKAKEYLDGKRLIVIRLRDLLQNYALLNIENPLADLTEYLCERKINRKKRQQFERTLYQDTVLVLDGFDELCMVENIYGTGKLPVYFK